ncbi:hypothetical protein DH2020_018480 [Rehmannia glutinosa]|uniref:Major facilitator superfamily (MFS) profile domain-containing protein n=1 Tax=Rehmannia glutinosa TaxID=99300 RepID=A0ABR0WJ27_REHGL
MAGAAGGLIFGYDLGISVRASVSLGDVSVQLPWQVQHFIPTNDHNRNTLRQRHQLLDGQNKRRLGMARELGTRRSPCSDNPGGILFPLDTPNSLVERGMEDEAKTLLKRIRGVDDVEAEFTDMLQARNEARLVENPWRNLVTRRCYRPQLAMSILIPFFQQFTGINVIMFYAPVLFKTLGFGGSASLMSSVITGIVNMFATGVSIYGCDRWGRRSLFLEGGIQMLIFQVAIAALIGSKFGVTGNVTEIPTSFASVVVACICVYVAGFAWSWGPLGWLYPSEIFPLEIRSAAQSVVVAVNMLSTFVVGQFFLSMLCAMKYGLFIFFAFFVVVMTLFCYFFMPETKNIPIEEMTQVWRNHWFWKRFMNDPNDPVNMVIGMSRLDDKA